MRKQAMGKGTLHQMIARVAFILSGYAFNIAMVHMLGDPRAYGLLGIVISVSNVARVPVASGLPSAASKFIAANDEELAYPIVRTTLKLQWIVSAAVVAVYCLAAPLLSRVLSDPTLTPYFWAAAPLIPLMGAFQVLQSYFNGVHRFIAQSWLNVLYSVSRVAFAIVVVYFGAKVYGVLAGFALSLALAALVSWYYVSPKTGSANPESRVMLSFAGPLVVLAIGQAVLVNLDLMQLKAYFPQSADVGYYSGMASLSRTPQFLFSAFSITLLPVVTHALRADGRERAGRLIARSTTLLLITALPVLAIMAAVPAELLDFVYPVTYTAAATALVWATFAQTILAVVASFSSAITADGKPYTAMWSWLICIPVQLLAGVWLIPRYGMTGTAIASLIAAAAGVVFSAAVTRMRFGTLLEPVPVLKGIAGAVVVYLLLSIPREYPMWLLPFACLAALGVYAAFVLATGAVKRDQVVSLFSRDKVTRREEEEVMVPE